MKTPTSASPAFHFTFLIGPLHHSFPLHCFSPAIDRGHAHQAQLTSALRGLPTSSSAIGSPSGCRQGSASFTLCPPRKISNTFPAGARHRRLEVNSRLRSMTKRARFHDVRLRPFRRPAHALDVTAGTVFASVSKHPALNRCLRRAISPLTNSPPHNVCSSKPMAQKTSRRSHRIWMLVGRCRCFTGACSKL